MPTSRASLSFVPNHSIASSLTLLGTPSTTRSPTSRTGDCIELLVAATSSATPSPKAPAMSPDSAPSSQYVHRCRRSGVSSCGAGRSTSLASAWSMVSGRMYGVRRDPPYRIAPHAAGAPTRDWPGDVQGRVRARWRRCARRARGRHVASTAGTRHRSGHDHRHLDRRDQRLHDRRRPVARPGRTPAGALDHARARCGVRRIGDELDQDARRSRAPTSSTTRAYVDCSPTRSPSR